MDNFNNNETFDSWDCLTEPTFVEKYTKQEDKPACTDNQSSAKINATKKAKSPILTFQLFVCIIILIALFLLKFAFPDYYKNFFECYDTEVNASLWFDGDVSSVDYSSFFNSSYDEI